MRLIELIKKVQKEKKAIGHFNVSTLEMLHGVFRASKALRVPVVIGVSEGERDFMGISQVVSLVKSLRKEFDYPIFINADHTYSFERVKEAIDCGFDMVVFDGADKDYLENLSITKKCVEYAKKSNTNVLIEAEVGYIGKSSKVLDKVPDGVSFDEGLPSVKQVVEFASETKVDLISPAVGNLHGKLKHSTNPNLKFDLIKAIRKDTNIPIILHGGSGLTDSNFVSAINAGISMVHISTEVRIAYKKALTTALNNSKEIAPYKYLSSSIESVEKVVKKYLKLFNKIK